MALEYVRKANYSLYRREDYYFYKGEKMKKIKENCLIIDEGNYNYLRLIFAKIPRVYWIRLFLIELVILYSRIFANYFIYRDGVW